MSTEKRELRGYRENASVNETSVLPSSHLSFSLCASLCLSPPLLVHLNPGITMSSQRLRRAQALIVCI